MRIFSLFFLLITLTLFSCQKVEGEGGRSSIIGEVHMTDKTGSNQGEYNAPDYDVFIIYGDDNNISDDDVKTSYDGSFEFKNLREGNYKVFAYSEDLSEPSGLKPVFLSAVIGKNQTVDIGTLELEK